MKVVDIERVVILMRFIQYGWDEERRKAFDENLRMMLETQCEDLAEHDRQIRAEVIDECIEIVRKNRNLFLTNAISEHFILGLEVLKEQNNEI